MANLYFAYMLTLCALLDCRERLVACNYLGEGEGVRPLMRQLVESPLLSARPVQRAAESLREHARSDNAQARRRGPSDTHPLARLTPLTPPRPLPHPTGPRSPPAASHVAPLHLSGRCGRYGCGRATCCAS